MKMTVLVPSEEYKAYAGARIRYDRIVPELALLGIELSLESIAEFKPQESDCDVLLISKCHDPRSLVAAAILSQKGARVGVDLFDDYFSQRGDSRLTRYRSWLSQLLAISDFALCSTAALARVAEQYRPGIPTHVMNDPAPDFDRKKLAAVLDRKAAETRASGCVQVAWFGVGDNPHFPVGLDDLAAFGGCLRELASGGMDVELRVLTNSRSLTAEGLSLLGRLPVRTSIDEWTEGRERALLRNSIAAFLPVSGQSFSTAKSLNRAVTALSAGCQVLSVGYPLYAAFESLIYRDPTTLMRDLVSGSLRFSSAQVDAFCDLVRKFASPRSEAERAARFLQAVEPSRRAANPLALIHGHSTNGLAHKLVQAAGGLSIASPFSTAPLGYDIVFREETDRLAMLVSQKAARRLPPHLQAKLQLAANLNGRNFLEIRERTKPTDGAFIDAHQSSLPRQLATYGVAMSEIHRRLGESFGPCTILLSETSPLPFQMVDDLQA